MLLVTLDQPLDSENKNKGTCEQNQWIIYKWQGENNELSSKKWYKIAENSINDPTSADNYKF